MKYLTMIQSVWQNGGG